MAMGMYGVTIGAAVAIGPLVGGVLTDSLGWGSIFYLNALSMWRSPARYSRRHWTTTCPASHNALTAASTRAAGTRMRSAW